MRKIDKKNMPSSLETWVRSKKGQSDAERYNQIHSDKRWDILQDVVEACSKEQFYICAYCCNKISGDTLETRVEHVEARDIAPNRSLDFLNMVASCKDLNQCDKAHANQELPLTPLMAECETELRFMLSGRVEGLTERAKTAISVLNLGDTEANNKALINKRQNMVDALIWTNYADDPNNLEFEEDKELIEILIEDLKKPVQGKLVAYSPVLVNILRQILKELP